MILTRFSGASAVQAMKTSLVIAALSLSACAGVYPPANATHAQIAKADCETWLGRHNLMQRPERGTRAWSDLVDVCVAKHQPWIGVEDAAAPAVR